MKIRLCFLILLLSVGYSVSAEQTIQRRFSVIDTSTQSSSIVFSNADSVYNNESLLPAITEIQNKIAENPNDNSLYISLVDFYFKTKQYEKAYEELVYLNNLSRKGVLTEEQKTSLFRIMENTKKNLKYQRVKAPIYTDLAIISLIIGDNVQAEKYISIVADSVTSVPFYRKAMELVYDSTGNSLQAIATCSKLILKNPNDVEARKLKAAYLLQSKNVDSAIEEYSKIIEINPTDTESRYYLYKLLESKGLTEKDIIKRMYKSEKINYEQVYYELADILLKNSNMDSARIFANALIEKYPNNANGYILLSEIYRKEGKLKESYDVLKEVRDKADSNEAIAKYNVLLAKLSDEPVKEANSLIATGLYQQALDVLDSANPENLYVILTQARANYMLGNKQQTLELLNKSMTLYPENSDVYCAFGYIYLKEKDLESARKYVDYSLKINPENRTAKDLLDMVNKEESDKYLNQITDSFEAQNYNETMRLINEALEINPKDPVLYYHKALTYIAQNNYAASTAILYKCIQLDKNNIPAYFYLGLAFDNLSEPENALMYYKKFIDLIPADYYGESEKIDYAKARIEKLKS